MSAREDVQIHRASSALLLRPDGRIERLAAPPRPRFDRPYSSPRAGRADAASHGVAARNDRRRSPRPATGTSGGQLVDLVV